jgi:hypothetical protein
MDNKRRFYRLFEFYLNELNKTTIEDWYGHRSSIKVNNVTFLQQGKSIVLEITIVLGEVISESVMDEKMAATLISEGMGYFFPELSLHVIYNWDY